MAAAASAEELIESLVERFPEDAEDLQEALAVLRQQRLHSRERLAKLNDSQWQRLGLPLGIESILRDEVAAAASQPSALGLSAAGTPLAPSPAVGAGPQALGRRADGLDDDGELPLEPVDVVGLRRRGGGGGGAQGNGSSSGRALASISGDAERRTSPLGGVDLTPPPELDELWLQLLEDTLPPDKRSALQDSWDAAASDHDRYMMFLEYSSYLRKPEITEEEKEERRKQLEPLMREFGLKADEEDSGWQGVLIWFLLVAVVFFVAGLVYYAYAEPDVMHDLQSL